MKRWAWRIALAVIVLGAGIWGFRVMFPGPQRVIRERLAQVEKLANIAPNEAPLAKLANAQQLAACFTEDPQIILEGTGYGRVVLRGQRELQDAAVEFARLEVVEDWKVPFREGVVYYLRDGRVRGVLLWGVWGQVDKARDLIGSPRVFRPEALRGLLGNLPPTPAATG